MRIVVAWLLIGILVVVVAATIFRWWRRLKLGLILVLLGIGCFGYYLLYGDRLSITWEAWFPWMLGSILLASGLGILVVNVVMKLRKRK